MHPVARRRDSEDGVITVFYALVLMFVLMPLVALGTSTLVRSTTDGELQQAADAGSLAGASEIPFGDQNFATNFIDATSGVSTDRSLAGLGLSYPGTDPLKVACDDVAVPDARSQHNVGHGASGLTCHASYVSATDSLVELRNCANAMTASPLSGVTNVPDLSGLLPALLNPGVKVTMSWSVRAPLDGIFNSHGARQSVTSIAHRRFKNMVVVPEVGLPNGDTINLNPAAGDVRGMLLADLQGTEQILASNPGTASCATALEAAHGDIADAIDPPGGGPSAQQILSESASQGSPVLVALTAVDDLGVPYLDFVPVCVTSSGSDFVGHLGNFGACSIDSPGAFRADLRRS